MSYIEIKAIKLVAALHRGVVNASIRSLKLRRKLATKKYQRQSAYAEGLLDLAASTKNKARSYALKAGYELTDTCRNILAAENTVLNLRDDLNKIQ